MSLVLCHWVVGDNSGMENEKRREFEDTNTEGSEGSWYIGPKPYPTQELGDWETHLLWWRFLNPWMIYVTQGLLRYINHHPVTDVKWKINHLTNRFLGWSQSSIFCAAVHFFRL
mmetsp:Transcript_50178/g.56829  ORF Transcript_50178/g.56829 Transcript_50178/m.56829 type:complete len:114 (-) Transcript_50178:417-758(-)